MYIHKDKDWPKFRWEAEQLVSLLAQLRHEQGYLLGQIQSLGSHQQQRAHLESLSADVIKSSEIEGESLDRNQVRSSVARHLGVDIGTASYVNRHVDAIVEMHLDATRDVDRPVDASRLFAWHAKLFPTEASGLARVHRGAWRDNSGDPMQVVSGPIGRQRVHFEAPPAARVPGEMARFLDHVNRDSTMDPVLKAGIAHLHFVTIHPFDDGNGRIARALTDLLLARSEFGAPRFYSMSSQIRNERDAYYDILERSQKGTLDITPWLEWFLNCLYRAMTTARETVANTIQQRLFWDRMGQISLNDRQRMILHRLLNAFEGKLTTSKYAKIAKCSHDTALRDIQYLIQHDILIQDAGGGRSTSYTLKTP